MDGLQLTAEQVQTIAAGLYALAASDGADDREVVIIREFVTDAGYPALSLSYRRYILIPLWRSGP